MGVCVFTHNRQCLQNRTEQKGIFDQLEIGGEGKMLGKVQLKVGRLDEA
jgi:hypothetical protein